MWEWRATTADGKRVTASAKTQAEAKRRCLEKLRQAEQGIVVSGQRQTVKQYLTWWLETSVDRKLAPKTVKFYRDYVRLHLEPELGKHQLGRLSVEHVDAMLARKEQAGLSPRTVCHIRAVLRAALSVAVKKRILERNVATLASPPRQTTAERRVFTVAEAKQLLTQVEGDRLAALYWVALTLGLRQGEIIGLRWQDVDLVAGTLRVQQSIQRVGGTLHIQAPKTDRSRRTLALSEALVKGLQAHKDARAFERRQAGDAWQDSGLVFTTETGEALEPRALVASFKRHLASAGLPETIRFYDMRHAAASLLLAEGAPLPAVSALLGHSLTSTTLNVYAHTLPGAERLTADMMDRLLG